MYTLLFIVHMFRFESVTSQKNVHRSSEFGLSSNIITYSYDCRPGSRRTSVRSVPRIGGSGCKRTFGYRSMETARRSHALCSC